ncbi:hypothetical protein [Paraburkholderia phytofirmans]|uniref:RNA polymerase, sigma-24 subunit, ECF subfamily n=1 Tax=Paraburkholderia phytofirmans TaxID=261302 RepID=A0ABW9BTJ9_9BURK
MKSNQNENFFARLISPMLDQLRRIAYGTRGEQSIEDLKTEAWIAAQDVRVQLGELVEPEDERLQNAVLSKLRKAFGKFVNRKMRFAVQLDHERLGDDGEFLPNSVAASLAGPDSYEPEIALTLREEHTAVERALAERFSEAVAYLRTLSHFDHDKSAIAGYLAIPASTLESRLKRAEKTARMQWSMFDGIETIPADFVPLPGMRRLSTIARTKSAFLACMKKRTRQHRLFSLIPALFDVH